MTADPHVLVQPCCPEPDDPDLQHLLQLLAEAAEASWLELRISADGSCSNHTFRVGDGGTDSIQLNLAIDGPFTACLTLGAPRPPSDGFARLAALAVGQTLRVHRLRRQAVLLRGALDTTSSAVLLFDSGGDIVYANPPADRLLSRQTEDGLVVEHTEEGPKPLLALLCGLVDRIASSPKAASSWKGTLPLSDGSVLACEIMRLCFPGLEHDSGVLAFLQTVSTTPTHCLAALAATYCLSPREQEVVRLVAEGLTTPSIAARMGISPHTVRDHLKRLYRKTGTRSRDDLFSLLSKASFVAPLGADASDSRP